MHQNQQLIEKFYRSFQKRDYKGMAECYHPEVEFSDPIFQNLKGVRATAMWQMLCERGKDLTLTFANIQADDQRGSADWVANYSFSATGRHVENKVKAAFRFKDGKIIEHHDSFDLWKWATMALGLKGRLLGWLPLVQRSIQKQGVQGLDQFMQKTP